DLSGDQIEVFARHKGVEDTKSFVEAIERADAFSFTSRPQDLSEVVEFWLEESRIGTRLEIIRKSIDRRLQERDQDRAELRPLAPDLARRGAKLVAAASTLAQQQLIRVPDGADNAKGLPVGDVLPEWDERDRLTLLSRPIFDQAIYGTVRFHHRSV